jgi:phage terminase small subunit
MTEKTTRKNRTTGRGNRPLPTRQQRFVAEYAVLGDAGEAALRAGYVAASAPSRGRALLARPEVARAVALALNGPGEADGLREGGREHDAVTSEWVVARLREVAERCMQAAPAAPARGAAGAEGPHYKFDAGAAIRALGLLGKHLGMFGTAREADDAAPHENALDELQ